MSVRCCCLSAVAVAALLSAHPARAQGWMGACARIIMEYVGKPLTKGMVDHLAEAGGGVVADYFLGKMQHSNSNEVVVSRSDVGQIENQAQARGMTECETRRQFESLYEQANSPYDSAPVMRPNPMPQMRPASICLTQFGTCMMNVPVPIGNSCFCATPMGNFPGVAQ